MENWTLRDGTKIPCIGYGTYKTAESDDPAVIVHEAILAGYRHIDTAAKYKNEDRVGEGIRIAQFDDDIAREDLFVTSKIWASERGYDKAMNSIRKSLMDLELEYIDLMLIHWPAHESVDPDWENTNRETWRALMDAKKMGFVKNIGVSNFTPKYLAALMDMDEYPVVDQIEYHPGWTQDETVKFCREHGILVEAWSPMARGRIFDLPLMQELSKKYQKSPAQICVRWCLENHVLPLPKASTVNRMLENLSMDDWKISEEDMAEINAMEPAGWSGYEPESVAW